MDVQTVVAAEHCVDGSDEVRDVVVDNLAINAEHEFFCTVEGGSCKDLKIKYCLSVQSCSNYSEKGENKQKNKQKKPTYHIQ